MYRVTYVRVWETLRQSDSRSAFFTIYDKVDEICRTRWAPRANRPRFVYALTVYFTHAESRLRGFPFREFLLIFQRPAQDTRRCIRAEF